MKTEPEFSLNKWYLDCVADNGDTFVAYSAALRWKAFSLHYSSITTAQGNSKSTTQTSLGKSSFPRISDRRIDWTSKPLDLTGTWMAKSEPIQRRLYDSAEGVVTWSCVQPRAKVDIFFEANRHMTGLGYAELLELTIKPWQLPISELRWGRFLSERDALVWIEWRGSRPLSMVFHNGREMRDTSIADDQIAYDGGRSVLTITGQVELRKGPLVSTALSSIPGVDKILPDRMLHTYECKWRSNGVLSTEGVFASSGWVVHEIVRFP